MMCKELNINQEGSEKEVENKREMKINWKFPKLNQKGYKLDSLKELERI